MEELNTDKINPKIEVNIIFFKVKVSLGNTLWTSLASSAVAAFLTLINYYQKLV